MLLANPYIISGSAFLLSLITYALYWSGIYPELSGSLLFFLLTFIGMTFCIGLKVNGLFVNALTQAKEDLSSILEGPRNIHICIILSIYVVEVIYNKGIPLIRMIQGENIDYRDFSFPVIHIFFTTFTSFFSLYSFLFFLKKGDRKYLFYNVLCVLIFVSLMHRSSILFILMNMLIMYSICRGINLKKTIITLSLVFCALFLFGLAGDIRTQAQLGDSGKFDSSVLMIATDADPVLLEHEMLHPLYWSYLYISSPLGNFQKTITYYQDEQTHSSENMILFLLYEVFPDLLTNKIAGLADYNESYSPLIKVIDFLTVGTIFADSFAFIGWFGPIILSMLFLLTPIVLYKITPKNHLYILQMSICSTIFALCTFSNMLVYSTFTLHFIYPLILSFRFFR